MPLFLIHGFRWPRSAIRVHVIVNNVEDAAPDYTMAASSCKALIASIRKVNPHKTDNLTDLSLVEEYDPEDLRNLCQPYAYVADKVVEMGLGFDVKDVQNHNLTGEAWSEMADLRDKMASGANLGWYVIYNGDPERGWDSGSEAASEETASALNTVHTQGSSTEMDDEVSLCPVAFSDMQH